MKFNLCTFVFMLLLGGVLSSCSQEDLKVASSNASNIENAYPYNIPVDSALAYLKTFMETPENGNTDTRADDNRNIASITPIKFYGSISRATQESLNCENLLYIANFEQEQGYAILAGDKRITEKVIAITDEGNLSDDMVYSCMQLVDPEKPILEEYPTVGPGFFTTPETGDELFINPNTVSLFIDSEQDTLVGNFDRDDSGATDENGKPIQQTRAAISSPELFACAICVSYAINEIKTSQPASFHPDPGPIEIIGGGPGGDVPVTRTETTYSDWRIAKTVNPILVGYKGWHQKEPFNELYPTKHKYLFFGCSRKAPAGCFPLAISKILTYFEYPSKYTYNGYTINWTELKRNVYSTIGRNSAAHLLKSISEGCESWYFYAGTFTFPKNAISYMRFLGLTGAHSYSYSFDRVKNMINDGKPLIICSVPGANVFKSHAWNIDGYKIKERTKTTINYHENTIVNKTETTEICNMVHCDFGWAGKSNGYYVSGVFKLNDSNAELDSGNGSGDSTNYNNALQVITY